MSDEWSDRRRESVAGKFIVDVQGISWQEFKDESGNIFYYNIATVQKYQGHKCFVAIERGNVRNRYINCCNQL